MDIKDPPTIVNNIRNKDKSKFDVYVVIPDVEIDDVIAKKILGNPSSWTIKK